MLRIKEHDGAWNPGFVPGTWFSMHGAGGGRHPSMPIQLMQACLLVDLELSVYETGGIPMLGKGSCIPGTAVHDLCVLGGMDPYGCGPVEPPKGLTFTVDSTCPTEPTMVICDADGEVAPGWTLPGGCVWIRIGYLP